MNYWKHSRKHPLIFGLLLSIGAMVGHCPCHGQLLSGSFAFEGVERQYLVFLPQNLQANPPLVFVLHGMSESPEFIMDYSQMNAVADSAGFIVVYPRAIAPGFNAGLVDYPGPRPLDLTVNDVGFISALIDTMDARHSADMNRVYCCGFSLGGEMTYRLAGELGYRFAAVASVCGKINSVSAAAYQRFRPMPVLHIHGTLDPYEYYYGGPANLWTAEETVNFWIVKNGCSLPPDTVALPDTDPADSCTVQRISFGPCSEDAPLIFYKIANGGHSWPGGCCDYPWANPTNRDFSASVEIWRFFAQHQNPLTSMAFGQWIAATPAYVFPEGDTLVITGRTRNPAGHPLTVYALLEGLDTSLRDSVELFDDGLHGDGEPADSVWGGAWEALRVSEGMFEAQLITYDNSLHMRSRLNRVAPFTTAGPVVPARSGAAANVRYLAPYRNQYFRLVLENTGSSASVRNISATISCDDPRLALMYSSSGFDDVIPAGAVDTSDIELMFRYSQGYGPGSDTANPIVFSTVIYSGDYPFWTGTFSFPGPDVVYADTDREGDIPLWFALKQNFPNPFNPSTAIEYALPHSGNVTLTVYNVLGEEVSRLIEGERTAGTFKAIWDASEMPSGVYFYRLKAGEYVKTRKMVLMR